VPHHLVDELLPGGPAEHLLAVRPLLGFLIAGLLTGLMTAMQSPHRVVLSLLLLLLLRRRLTAVRVTSVVPGVLLGAWRAVVGVPRVPVGLLLLLRTSPRHPAAGTLKRVSRQCKGALEPCGAARFRGFNLFLHAQLALGHRFHHRCAAIGSRGFHRQPHLAG